MDKPTILVTGGLGYIGSHNIDELIKNDFQVVILDNLCNSSKKCLDRLLELTGRKMIPFEIVDITDEKSL